MNLYEINKQILECIDIETGEILDEDKLNELEMVRSEKRENIVLFIKNLQAENDGIKKEIENFQRRKKTNENKIKNLSMYLALDLQEKEFKTSKCNVTFRKSQKIEIDDNFIEWAKQNNRSDLLRYKEPEVDKTKLKELIKDNNESFEYARIVDNTNINIK